MPIAGAKLDTTRDLCSSSTITIMPLPREVLDATLRSSLTIFENEYAKDVISILERDHASASKAIKEVIDFCNTKHFLIAFFIIDGDIYILPIHKLSEDESRYVCTVLHDDLYVLMMSFPH